MHFNLNHLRGLLDFSWQDPESEFRELLQHFCVVMLRALCFHKEENKVKLNEYVFTLRKTSL